MTKFTGNTLHKMKKQYSEPQLHTTCQTQKTDTIYSSLWWDWSGGWGGGVWVAFDQPFGFLMSDSLLVKLLVQIRCYVI